MKRDRTLFFVSLTKKRSRKQANTNGYCSSDLKSYDVPADIEKEEHNSLQFLVKDDDLFALLRQLRSSKFRKKETVINAI